MFAVFICLYINHFLNCLFIWLSKLLGIQFSQWVVVKELIFEEMCHKYTGEEMHNGNKLKVLSDGLSLLLH